MILNAGYDKKKFINEIERIFKKAEHSKPCPAKIFLCYVRLYSLLCLKKCPRAKYALNLLSGTCFWDPDENDYCPDYGNHD